MTTYESASQMSVYAPPKTWVAYLPCEHGGLGVSDPIWVTDARLSACGPRVTRRASLAAASCARAASPSARAISA